MQVQNANPIPPTEQKVQTSKRPLRWVIYVLLALLLLPILLLIAGAGYQAIGTAVDARRYPPPGVLVDGGGYRMHIYCAGERRAGLPTVILDAGHPATSSSWVWVQPEVSTAARTCSYDRAGTGWSDASPATSTMGRMAQELHALLESAGEPGPYLLVGHSWGGGVTRLFAAYYPEQVSGLVWIEATHPDSWRRRGMAESTLGGVAPGMVNGIPTATRLGVFRLFPALLGGWGTVPGLPELQQAELRAYFNTAKWADYVVAVERALPQSLEALRRAGGVGDTPLAIVLGGASEEADDVDSVLQQELAGLSTNSAIYRVEGADHSSLVHDRRYALEVSAVILQMIAATR